ncbi:alpha/beta fold hydrolase [Desertivirga brevis]|uniref:alpha/beta fold hydrolase n=1 Tax=Desertivirga brevis TaxID=2810310 RepID=UPI001A969D11|nr:alpha/beta hydrolase [Pedobacter sp. SYSU D00873]
MIDIVKRNNVRIYGNGNQCMLMAHGFGCDQNVWRHLIKAFESRYKIVVFDYVGAGQSDIEAYDPNRYSSLDGYAEDVNEVIQALELSKVIFIGHSVSSMIGLRAAIRHPEQFERLIMVAPSPSYINSEDYVGGMNREDIESLFEVMDANYLGWSTSMAPLIMGNPQAPELGDELAANFCATDPEIAREFARVTFFSDNRSDLQKLKVKSLSLQCSEDILAPLEVGYYIERNTPQNTLVIMKATGHCPHLSAPEETIAAIENYLDTH